MAIIADFMLVWLPAPTVALGNSEQKGQGNRVQEWIASCPDNAFQVNGICTAAGSCDLRLATCDL